MASEAVFWQAWPCIDDWRRTELTYTRQSAADSLRQHAVMRRVFRFWVDAAMIFPPPLVDSSDEGSIADGFYIDYLSGDESGLNDDFDVPLERGPVLQPLSR